MSAVHVVVPASVHDPGHPSGGNTYDRKICAGLAALGWSVHEHAVTGRWPSPDPAALAALAEILAEIPDGSVVLVDGLVASTVPELLVPQRVACAWSSWSTCPWAEPARGGPRCCRRGGGDQRLDPPVAARHPRTAGRPRPGREAGGRPGRAGRGNARGGELLCVGAYTQAKGYDVLLAALVSVRDLRWRCRCVGTLTGDSTFVDDLGRAASAAGIEDRVRFTGPLAGPELDDAYATADVLVLASRAETYGMVVTEALARGLPVIAAAVGGCPRRSVTSARAAGRGC